MIWVFYLYLVIGILAFIGFIIILIFGGVSAFDFDVDIPGVDVGIDGPDADIGIEHGGPGPFSLPVILGFLSSFGTIGAILTYYGVHYALTPFLSIAVAVLVALVMFLIIAWMFKKLQSDSTVSYRGLIGKEATVSVSIKEGREGQIVLFTEQRGRTLVPAIADEDIPADTYVVIKEVVGDAVKVRKRKVSKKV